MIFTLSDIYGLRNGQFSERQVGELPNDVLLKLGWKSPIVYLSGESLKHINDDHSDITDFDVLLLPQMIAGGLLIQENAKPHCLTVCHQGENKRICAVLKMAVSTKFDIWVCSVRPLKPKQTRAMLRRGTMIRPHK